MIAYCFAEKKRFSKFGNIKEMQIHNDGTFIYLLDLNLLSLFKTITQQVSWITGICMIDKKMVIMSIQEGDLLYLNAKC